MENWMIAAVPPLLVWFGLFLYMMRAEKRLRAVEQRLRQADQGSAGNR